MKDLSALLGVEAANIPPSKPHCITNETAHFNPTGLVHRRPNSTGHMNAISSDMDHGMMRHSLSALDARPIGELPSGDARYTCDLVSRDGMDVYRYPSPLHAVAMQSPIFFLLRHNDVMKKFQESSSKCQHRSHKFTIAHPTEPGLLTQRLDRYIRRLLQHKKALQNNNVEGSLETQSQTTCDTELSIENVGDNCSKISLPCRFATTTEIQESQGQQMPADCVAVVRSEVKQSRKVLVRRKVHEHIDSSDHKHEQVKWDEYLDKLFPLIATGSNAQKQGDETTNAPEKVHKAKHNYSVCRTNENITGKEKVASAETKLNNLSPNNLKGQLRDAESLNDLTNAIADDSGSFLQVSVAKVLKTNPTSQNAQENTSNGSECLSIHHKVRHSERSKQAQLKHCRFSEDVEVIRQRQDRFAGQKEQAHRSQSDNSIAEVSKTSTEWTSINQVEPSAMKILGSFAQDARSKKIPSQRKWRSTVEICQGVLDRNAAFSHSTVAHPARRGMRKDVLRPLKTETILQPWAGQRCGGAQRPMSDSECSTECESVQQGETSGSEERGDDEEEEGEWSDCPLGCPGDSNTSLSESCSSVDRISSQRKLEVLQGELVWPHYQQGRPTSEVPFQMSSHGCFVATPSDNCLPQAKICRIKASHALKKKILRCRSGSLKLMTTV
uniref:dapper 1-like isoform X2 n=1 Tax=Myxine glutinosa TaxID=7769 RepID=UPI00358EE27C